MANKGTRDRRPAARRNKHQAEWLRDQYEKKWPGKSPVMEMAEIAHKEDNTDRDREQFKQLAEIAQYLQAKLKHVEMDHGLPDGEGEITFRWKRPNE